MKKALLALLLLSNAGCGTVLSLARPDYPKLMGGVRLDLQTLDNANHGVWLGWLSLIDLPLSLALDLALLPATIPWEALRDSSNDLQLSRRP
jgi:uncharacterized protein YceK